jgi:hypothetical protein
LAQYTDQSVKFCAGISAVGTTHANYNAYFGSFEPFDAFNSLHSFDTFNFVSQTDLDGR